MVRLAARLLGPLRDEVVFVGGAVVGLLLTDPAAKEPRSTQDVDVVVEVGTTMDYYRLETTIRGQGFENVLEGPITRFRQSGLLLDVIPTSEEVLGFGNRWYEPAMRAALPCDLGDGDRVRIITAPYFLATKFVAFEAPDREDSGEYLFSRDFEDIVTVVDGRAEIVDEIRTSDENLRAFLRERIERHGREATFEEGVAAHLEVDAASQARTRIVIQRLRAILDDP